MFHLQLFSYLLIMKQDSVSLHKNLNFMWPSLNARITKSMDFLRSIVMLQLHPFCSQST